MKTALILITLFINTPSFADCRHLISKGQDSFAYRFYVDHDLREQSEKCEMAIMIIKTVMHEVGCSLEESEALTFKSKTCQYINPLIKSSYSCFMEATEGYYFITQDQMSNINVIFNRWD